MDDIANVFSAVSVILFFMGMLFNNFRIKQREIMDIRPEKDKVIAQKNYLKKRKECIWFGILLTSFTLGFFYMLLPTAIEVISNSKFSLWNFGLLNTLYLFICVLCGLLGLYTVYLLIVLWIKPRKTYSWLFSP